MALTNTQYESIIREYEETAGKHRRDFEMRRAEVYEKIPAYRDLEDAGSSLSVEYTRKLIDGEPHARENLTASLQKLALEKKRLLTAHKFPADYMELHYTCNDCKDTGFIGSKKCHCFEKKAISLLYEQSGIMEVLLEENFHTLSYQYFKGDDLVAYQKTVKVCQDFVTNFDEEDRNLLFTGSVGSGKSFLSNCIAKALMDSGHSVIYFSAIDFFDMLSKKVFDKNKENLYSFYEDLYNCDLVIIDDLGTELTNSFVCTYFFNFLNERRLHGKSSLISTNLTLKELGERYDDRTFSRLVSNYDVCTFSGPDIRIQKRS